MHLSLLSVAPATRDMTIRNLRLPCHTIARIWIAITTTTITTTTTLIKLIWDDRVREEILAPNEPIGDPAVI